MLASTSKKLLEIAEPLDAILQDPKIFLEKTEKDNKFLELAVLFRTEQLQIIEEDENSGGCPVMKPKHSTETNSNGKCPFGFGTDVAPVIPDVAKTLEVAPSKCPVPFHKQISDPKYWAVFGVALAAVYIFRVKSSN